ncbi:MAG TPA: hypothetical protein VM299_06835 [Solirubrobacteraceae bacterium]|jgi:hypothetical protein|nr:hypothetical protein [Solirubrobacteraceae bacterium]
MGSFALGEVTLEDLREAARAEKIDQRTAQETLKLIAEWESHRAWSRNDFRARVRRLMPPPAPKTRDGNAMYDAGLNAYRR